MQGRSTVPAFTHCDGSWCAPQREMVPARTAAGSLDWHASIFVMIGLAQCWSRRQKLTISTWQAAFAWVPCGPTMNAKRISRIESHDV